MSEEYPPRDEPFSAPEPEPVEQEAASQEADDRSSSVADEDGLVAAQDDPAAEDDPAIDESDPAPDDEEPVTDEDPSSSWSLHDDEGPGGPGFDDGEAPPEGGVHSEVDGSVGGDVITAGGDVTKIVMSTGKRDQPRVSSIPEHDLTKAVEVFVMPSATNAGDFRPAVLWGDRDRVVLVAGGPRMGTQTWALALTQAWCVPGSRSSAFVCHPPVGEELDLLQFVESRQLPNGAACVIENIEESWLDARQLEGLQLTALVAALSEKEAVLVLTTRDVRPYAEAPVRHIALGERWTANALKEALRRHAMHFEYLNLFAAAAGTAPALEPLEALWSMLPSRQGQCPFVYAHQINTFSKRLYEILLERGIEGPGDELHRAVAEAHAASVLDGPAASLWFERLDRTARLDALLLALFEGMEQPRLDEIHVAVAQALRAEGMARLADPRERALDRRLRAAHARVRAGHVIEFDDPTVAEHVRGRLETHTYLLPVLTALFRRPDASWRQAGEAGLKRLWGQALGRVGVHASRRYLEALRELAADAATNVAGYALEESCRRSGAFAAEAVGALEAWARVPALREAVSGAAARLCRVVRSESGDWLRILNLNGALFASTDRDLVRLWREARTQHQRMPPRDQLDAVRSLEAKFYESLAAAWRVDPARTAALLGSWTKGRPQSGTRRAAAEVLALVASDAGGRAALTSPRQPAFVALLEAVLGLDPVGASEAIAVDRALGRARHAVGLAGDETLGQLAPALLGIAASAPPPVARCLAAWVAPLWVTNPEAPVAQAARSVVRQVQAARGLRRDVPRGGALLLVEARSREWPPAALDALADGLHCRLAARFGQVERRAFAGPWPTPDGEGSANGAVRPRLVAPLAETHVGARDLVVVVTTSPVHDLDDLLEVHGDRLVVVAREDLTLPSGVRRVPLASFPKRAATLPAFTRQSAAEAGERVDAWLDALLAGWPEASSPASPSAPGTPGPGAQNGSAATQPGRSVHVIVDAVSHAGVRAPAVDTFVRELMARLAGDWPDVAVVQQPPAAARQAAGRAPVRLLAPLLDGLHSQETVAVVARVEPFVDEEDWREAWAERLVVAELEAPAERAADDVVRAARVAAAARVASQVADALQRPAAA